MVWDGTHEKRKAGDVRSPNHDDYMAIVAQIASIQEVFEKINLAEKLTELDPQDISQAVAQATELLRAENANLIRRIEALERCQPTIDYNKLINKPNVREVLQEVRAVKKTIDNAATYIKAFRDGLGRLASSFEETFATIKPVESVLEEIVDEVVSLPNDQVEYSPRQCDREILYAGPACILLLPEFNKPACIRCHGNFVIRGKKFLNPTVLFDGDNWKTA